VNLVDEVWKKKRWMRKKRIVLSGDGGHSLKNWYRQSKRICQGQEDEVQWEESLGGGERGGGGGRGRGRCLDERALLKTLKAILTSAAKEEGGMTP